MALFHMSHLDAVNTDIRRDALSTDTSGKVPCSQFVVMSLIVLEYVTVKPSEGFFLFQTQRYMPMLCSTPHAPLSPSSSGRQLFHYESLLY